MESEKWVVGAEYDDAVLAGLGKALRELDFGIAENWAGVAGSQDIAHWNVTCPDGSLVVEVETYVGVTVEGPRPLVAALRAAFERQPVRAHLQSETDASQRLMSATSRPS